MGLASIIGLALAGIQTAAQEVETHAAAFKADKNNAQKAVTAANAVVDFIDKLAAFKL